MKNKKMKKKRENLKNLKNLSSHYFINGKNYKTILLKWTKNNQSFSESSFKVTILFKINFSSVESVSKQK